MVQKSDPVGVIDSGIGGFSVVRQVQKLLPGEDLIYFGDGAHVPYGNHSRAEIVELARYMFGFMERRGVKALLAACNTISCVAEDCSGAVSCPVFSAVRAGAEGAARLEAEKVGVISTVFTHNARCYPREIAARSPRKVVVLSCGCPDLAALVEHSLGDPARMPLVEENLRQELDHLVLEERIQALVLGCTHYPLVEDSIRRLYPGLTLVDPAEEMARALERYLDRQDLRARAADPGRLEIYTTGSAEEYALRARQVGLERVSAVLHCPPLEM